MKFKDLQPPEEHMALVDQILDTLNEHDNSLDGQWALEAETRLAAYRRGEVQAIPLNEVIAKYQVKRGVVVCANSHTA
jgi:putative addiction module component (TIGR02574 family)